MRIAQIAPLWKSVTPPGTSDAERVLSDLIDELVRRGHEVTLFASADSCTSAKLEAFCETPFCQTPANWSRAGATIMAMEQMFRTRAHEFDIIHSHFGIDGFPMAGRSLTPTLTTLHDRLDLPEYVPVFMQFQHLPLVSTSDAQRLPVSWASWQQTIYPGMPSERSRFHPRPGTYLAFMGSLSPEQGLGLAIELARRAQLPLRIASRQGSAGGFHLPMPMELLIADSGVEWLGELCEEETQDFLGDALALVCTQNWPGPSELCIAEALACGTPVVAFHRGNAAEMIYDQVTGFVRDSLEEMVDVLPLLGDLDRNACRSAFEQRFSTERMADEYLQLYERLIGAATSSRMFGSSTVQGGRTDMRPMAILN